MTFNIKLIISFYKSTEKVSMYIFINFFTGVGSGSSFVSFLQESCFATLKAAFFVTVTVYPFH